MAGTVGEEIFGGLKPMSEWGKDPIVGTGPCPLILGRMKNKQKKLLTFGELIAAACRVWGETKGGEMMRMAIKSRLVVYQEHGPLLISAGEGEVRE